MTDGAGFPDNPTHPVALVGAGSVTPEFVMLEVMRGLCGALDQAERVNGVRPEIRVVHAHEPACGVDREPVA